MNEFLGFITQTYFPEFHTFPVLAKMGHLDLAYTSGADEARFGYKRTTDAVFKRNWKLAAQESYRPTLSAKRNGIVRAWLGDAARKEHFFIHPNCKKQLKVLVK